MDGIDLEPCPKRTNLLHEHNGELTPNINGITIEVMKELSELSAQILEELNKK